MAAGVAVMRQSTRLRATGYGLRTSTSDSVTDVDGKDYRTANATIWRWRHAYQNDFAARMAWSVTADVKQANHNPQPVLNGQSGSAIVNLQVKAAEVVYLPAKGTRDPDGDRLSYRWRQYKEPTATTLGIHFAPELKLEQSEGEALH